MTTTPRPKLDPPKPGSKLDKLVSALISDGSTIRGLSNDLGWLPHTTRAALTRLKKRGYLVERIASEGAAESIYRIKTKPARKASK